LADEDARLTQPDTILGTPDYIAPEQVGNSATAGPASDLYSLGCTLYELLTGRPPFHDHANKLLAHLESPIPALPPELGVPAGVERVLGRLLAKRAKDRYGSAREFEEELGKAVRGAEQARFDTAADLAAALRAAVRQPRWPGVVVFAALFLAAAAGGWLLGQPGRRGGSPVDTATLEVQVWRPDTHFSRLREALPVHTGDELQVRFRVPPGLHVGLCSINGDGRLTLLQRYPPQKNETEQVYPGPDRTRDLKPPSGTEILLVCGRTSGAVSEAELQTMWDGAAPWPALDRPEQLFRLQLNQVREEGERSRDFGTTHHRPGSDAVARRLDELRERLRRTYTFLDGLAFVHQ
jgi:hypothetical protein